MVVISNDLEKDGCGLFENRSSADISNLLYLISFYFLHFILSLLMQSSLYSYVLKILRRLNTQWPTSNSYPEIRLQLPS
jgi:hypothetical protein